MFALAASLTAVPASWRPVIADAPALADLPVSPFSLLLLLAWVYFGLFYVRMLEENPSLPRRLRTLVQLASLVAGPLVWLAVSASQRKKSSSGGLAGRWRRYIDPLFRVIRLAPHASHDDDTLQLINSSGTDMAEIYGHGELRSGDRQTLNLTMEIIGDAVRQRASDILIDPKDQTNHVVRLRVDGILRTIRELPAATSRAVINSVKAVASMDISERRRPQDGAFSARRGETSISFRVASSGVLNGEKLSIRVLNQDASKFTLSDVGLPGRHQAVIAEALSRPAGLVLICGPTGSGKTTTMYAMLGQIDRYTRNVITVEDPIEAHLPEVSQHEINAKAEITFGKALRAILRENPDVICVGEIRDEETAEIGVRAAQTGHLVLATIHCDSNATALVRLLDLGVSPMLLSSALSLIMSQRLVRNFCPHCKRPAELDSKTLELVARMGLQPQGVLQAVGCAACSNSGYYGRIAVCDLLSVTDALRSEIAQDPTIAAKLRTDGEKKGRMNLRTEALRLVAGGITTLDEVKRIVG